MGRLLLSCSSSVPFHTHEMCIHSIRVGQAASEIPVGSGLVLSMPSAPDRHLSAHYGSPVFAGHHEATGWSTTSYDLKVRQVVLVMLVGARHHRQERLAKKSGEAVRVKHV